MRQVTDDITTAFLEGRKRTVGNSHTDGENLFLHGNKIAYKESQIQNPHYEALFISNAGWLTKVTKERLNGLLKNAGFELRIFQKKKKWYMSEISDGIGLPFPKDEWMYIGILYSDKKLR